MSFIENSKTILSSTKLTNLLSGERELKDRLEKITDYSSDEYVLLLKDLNKIESIKHDIADLEKEIKAYSDALELLNDPELKEIAELQLNESESKGQEIISKLEIYTKNPLPNDDKKAIIEIRPGVGGVEAALFAEEMLRMYLNFLKSEGSKVEIFSIVNNPEGGINEGVFLIDEYDSFGKYRFEGGVHRVQRVPKTEAMGRIHTSTVSVVVIPKFDEKSINISPNDIRIDVYRSSGPGGQSVNTTDSAVRITHIPTGIIVTCQNGKSQHKNKEMAMSVLFGKLQEIEEEKKLKEANMLKKESVENSERSSKIRTYNFPQSRITDHRLNQSWFNITEIMEGSIKEIIDQENKNLRD